MTSPSPLTGSLIALLLVSTNSRGKRCVSGDAKCSVVLVFGAGQRADSVFIRADTETTTKEQKDTLKL